MAASAAVAAACPQVDAPSVAVGLAAGADAGAACWVKQLASFARLPANAAAARLTDGAVRAASAAVTRIGR